MTRATPCSRCGYRMASWKSGDIRPKLCDDSETASAKCSHCAALCKPCVTCSGLVKAAVRQLAAFLSTVAPDTIDPPVGYKEKALIVKKALQGKKDESNMSSVKLAAKKEEEKEEQRERELLALETRALAADRLASAIERTTAAISQQANAVELLALSTARVAASCEAFVSAYEKVNADALALPSDDEDKDNDDDDEGDINEVEAMCGN